MIWKYPVTLEALNQSGQQTMSAHLDIKYTEIAEDYIVATMPVDYRTVQPFRLLHGGASAVLAETLGSVAGWMSLSPEDKLTVVGVELNINHLRSAKEGDIVSGKVSPIKLGRQLQVWQIEIHDQNQRHIATSRLTVAVVPNGK